MDAQKKFKILIADDEPDLLELIVEEFEYHGHDVFFASCGVEAIAILKIEKIDVVLSDLRMPNGNGMSILRFVNLMEEKPIFFFFSSDYTCIDDCLKLGASQFFCKPFSFDQLVSEVEKESIIFFKRMLRPI